MKAHIKIPKGWKLLRNGTPTRHGDRYFAYWNYTWDTVGVFSTVIYTDRIIRKVRKKR